MDYIISESQLSILVESSKDYSDKLFSLVNGILGSNLEYKFHINSSTAEFWRMEKLGDYVIRYELNPKTKLWREDGRIEGTIYLTITSVNNNDELSYDTYYEFPEYIWEDLEQNVEDKLESNLGPIFNVDFDYVFDSSINEDVEYGDDESKSPHEIVDVNWFDLNLDALSDYDRQMVEKLKNDNVFDKWFQQTMAQLLRRYSTVNKVIAKEDGKMVGFLIWAQTTPKLEGVSDDETPIPVIVSTAVSPNYRKKGLYNNIFSKTGISGDYLVHASKVLSPFEFWERKGCKVVHDINYNNKIMYCKS